MISGTHVPAEVIEAVGTLTREFEASCLAAFSAATAAAFFAPETWAYVTTEGPGKLSAPKEGRSKEERAEARQELIPAEPNSVQDALADGNSCEFAIQLHTRFPHSLPALS